MKAERASCSSFGGQGVHPHCHGAGEVQQGLCLQGEKDVGDLYDAPAINRTKHSAWTMLLRVVPSDGKVMSPNWLEKEQKVGIEEYLEEIKR